MRRRCTILWAALLVLLLGFSAAAEQAGISAVCDSTLHENRLFYVDIRCDAPLRSLQLNVTYDASAVAFRSAACADDGAMLRHTGQDGETGLVWAGGGASAGTLFTLCFKSLSAGSSAIVIETVEAVGEDLNYFEDGETVTFDVVVGDTGVELRERERGVAVERRKKTARQTDPKRRSTADEIKPTETSRAATVNEIDLTPRQKFPILPILCGVLLAALLVGTGILIGRKMKK